MSLTDMLIPHPKIIKRRQAVALSIDNKLEFFLEDDSLESHVNKFRGAKQRKLLLT